MEATTEQKLSGLYHLQLIDYSIDKIHSIRGELPIEVSDLEDEIAGLETRKEKLNHEIDESNRNIEACRNAIKNSQNLIVKYEQQIENVKNNREYLALTKEIEMQKIEILGAEKKIKELFAIIEERKVQIDQNAELLSERGKDLTTKKEELHAISSETTKEEGELNAVRTIAFEVLDERLKAAYSRIRNNFRNKLAVVSIDRDACAGCFTKIPPQRQMDIKSRKKIIVCENCGRVLIDTELAETVKLQIEERLGKSVSA